MYGLTVKREECNHGLMVMCIECNLCLNREYGA